MMLYNVEFSQDGKTFDDYIGDYVKAWNAEEAKDYALTWYTENGGKEEDIEDLLCFSCNRISSSKNERIFGYVIGRK